jgi:hypothetical protein
MNSSTVEVSPFSSLRQEDVQKILSSCPALGASLQAAIRNEDVELVYTVNRTLCIIVTDLVVGFVKIMNIKIVPRKRHGVCMLPY